MTLAICWKCGAAKVGALTTCANCGTAPAQPTDKATSLLLSDPYREPDELMALAQEIARGAPPRFDESEFARVLEVVRNEPRMPWGCVVAVWIPIVLLLLLAIVVAWLYRAGAYR
jgi:hypothetical protein